MGIIPTRVGTSYIFCFAIYAYWDHPHACGDKLNHRILIRSFIGSSPRVWGQADAEKKDMIERRIIPTRVGTRML